jgi:hypothetical protein
MADQGVEASTLKIHTVGFEGTHAGQVLDFFIHAVEDRHGFISLHQLARALE